MPLPDLVRMSPQPLGSIDESRPLIWDSPSLVRVFLRGSDQELWYSPGDGFYQYADTELDTTKTPEGAPLLPKRQLIKEWDNDITDLLYHIFKDQPRIVGTTAFQAELYQLGRRHSERDASVFRGSYAIYFKGDSIAKLVCRPHKRVSLFKISNTASRTYFAQQLLVRVLHDLFPEARIKEAT